MGRVGAVLAVLATVLALPAGAGAVTASVSGNTLTLTGGPESNQVKVRQGAQTVLVSDTTGVTEGDGCQSDGGSETAAICGDSSTTAIVANLGDGINRFESESGLASSWEIVTSILVNGGAGPDTIGPDTRLGAPWTVNGGGGGDTIQGSNENDKLNGDAGIDDINGEAGNDVIHGGTEGDTLFGNTGRDKLYGETGNDDLDGSDGDDLVDGGAGRDKLKGEGSDQSSGDDTINAVDGEKDTVTCGFGTDVANVDDIDVVAGEFDCEQVNVKKPRPTTTPPPKPHAYKKHCHKKDGKNVCKQPHAKKGKTYKGKTSQGSKVTTGLSSNGKYFVFHVKYVTLTCSDGEEFDEQDVELVGADKQKLAKNGTVKTSVSYDPSEGYSDEVIHIAAAFDGGKARGALAANAKWTGHGSCTSGKVGWTAKT